MRKIDLIKRVSEKTKIPVSTASDIIETALMEIRTTIINGENLYVRGFGSFVRKKRKQKIGRIVKENIAIVIPEHFIPAFKPAKIFCDAVKATVENIVL